MINTFRQYKNTIFLVCLTASIVTLPFSIRANSIFIILLVICWLLKDSMKEKISYIRNPLFILFISLYIVHLIGMFYTFNIQQGFFELEKKLSLLIFPLILGTTAKIKYEDVQKILYYFVASCIIVSVFCLLYAGYRTISSGSFYSFNSQTQYTTYYFFYDGLSDVFIHPVYFSAYIVFSFFIVLKNIIANWMQNPATRNVFKSILLCYLITFLLLLSSRIMIITFFALILSYILYLFFKQKKKWLGISISMLVALVLISSVIFIPYVRERISELYTSSYVFKNNPETNINLSGKMDAVEMRMANWYFTIQAGKNTWLFGTGTGDDEDVLMSTYQKNNFMEGYVPKFNSHSQFFQTWLGLGVVGLLILLLNLFIPLYISWKTKNYYYMIFILVISLFCFTESIFCRQWGVVFYAFLNSLFAFHTLKRRCRLNLNLRCYE
ncbi:MAG: O-antigen ligase family protein [Bacteroidota bacterium]